MISKPCDKCSTPLVSMSSIKKRYCVSCHEYKPWNLKPGQKPLVRAQR